MRMKKLHKVLFIITITLLVIVFIQTFYHVFTLKPLKGAEVKAEMPKLTFQTYTDGSFQRDFDNYTRSNFGFREYLLRFYNQYIWTCYDKTFNSYILQGKNGWLYELEFVQDHYESLMYKYTNDTSEMKQKFDTEALRLWKVQKLLKEHDIDIFVNLIPGKDYIYPEYLPENQWYKRPQGIHAYEYYKSKFDELGINYIDNIEIFRNAKDIVDYQLFPKTGTHWTNIAASHAFDSIIKYMENISGRNMLNLHFSKKYIAENREPDDDLEQLLNLAFPIKPNVNYYTDVTVITDSTAIRPNIITIGDSYFWTISYNIPLSKIFTKYPYWYYNSSIYFDDKNTSTSETNLEKELMDADFIMLNYCTAQVYKLGNQFIQKALLHLCYDSIQINEKAKSVIENIRSSESWYSDIKEKAKVDGISIDQELLKNAVYVIEQEPEKYFAELSGNQLPAARNTTLMKSERLTYFEKKVQDLKNYILDEDANWLESIKKKAAENGISVEDQLDADVRWIVKEEMKNK